MIVTDHLGDFAPNWERIFLYMKIEFFFGNFIPSMEITVNFEARCWLEHITNVITTHFNCSFLLTLALKTRICIMALLVLA